MEKREKLAKNIIIFAIGTFSSKLLQFLLIPFYTRVLTNSEYGTIDILQSIASLLIPIISLTIAEAVFRYSMEENIDKSEVLSIGFFISIVNTIISLIIAYIIYKFTYYEYIFVLSLYMITNIFRSIFSQFTKAIGKSIIYTIDNILNILITIIFNIIFLVYLNQGISGYLWGYVIGNIFSIIILFSICKLYKYIDIDIKKININVLKKMLLFSLPLIPGSICWWITNFADRWMITVGFGSAVNGIYAISYKVPTIITIIVNVFFQAWQISANKEFKSKDIAELYSNIFNYLFVFIVVISNIMMTGCKIITRILVGDEFLEAWYYMPTLLLGTIFFTMAEYLGTIYTASKNTKMAFITTMVASIINIFANIILLKSIGAIGAAVATAICYFVLWIYRAKNTKKLININYNQTLIYVSIITTIINTIIITLQFKIWYLYSIILVVFIILLNYRYIIELINNTKCMIIDNLIMKNK